MVGAGPIPARRDPGERRQRVTLNDSRSKATDGKTTDGQTTAGQTISGQTIDGYTIIPDELKLLRNHMEQQYGPLADTTTVLRQMRDTE